MTKFFNILLVLTLLFFSCKRENPYDKYQEVTSAKAEPWIRYEILLNEIDTSSPQQGLNSLIDKYPAFSTIYFLRVINDSYNPDTSFVNIFNAYNNSVLIRQLIDTLPQVFPDLKEEEKEYADAFSKLNKIFPQIRVPVVFTCLTEFGTGAFSTSDDVMAISLEMYFGKGNKYYDTETWPIYIQRTMNKENIVPNLIKNYIRNSVLPAIEPKTLLDHMIQQGKEVYLLKHVLPEDRDTVVYNYTPAQLGFCRENEKEMWSYFLSEKLVYSEDFRKIQKYVNPSPTSPGMPASAPGRSSAYIGGQIIEAYMERHQELDIKRMINNTNSQQILEEAKYKP